MSIVKITPASEAISCKAGDSSTFQFNISNDAGRDLRIGLQIRADGEACQWLTPDGALERDLSAGVDTTVSVVATPPQNLVGEGQGAKTATFRLRVYDVRDTESAVDSPTVTVNVNAGAAPKPPTSPWKWLIPLLIALLLITGGLAWYLLKPDPVVVIEPPPPPPPPPVVSCAKTIHGKIAWNYEGNKRWSKSNLQRLCKGAEQSPEPGRCFNTVMHGGVNHGTGTRWETVNAIDLCEGTKNAKNTVTCFKKKISIGNSWQDAIKNCTLVIHRINPGHFEVISPAPVHLEILNP